ncbi:hypothetical protein AAFF_G00033250 [Aldrovandia affinis]|uniref:Uncharacterized protein n=1 Tax=Aldrovandia affinis TaxID=143900 RepID=A0AAD7WG36_9TELE|nr:hypothetical protein AAFF_G00033250 [Aldrovandia affinis]
MRLKSRRPFVTHAQELLRITPSDTSKASWVKARWRDQWKSSEPSRLHHYIEDPTDVLGQHLPRKQWTTLNRLRTACMHASLSHLRSSKANCGRSSREPISVVTKS